MYSLQSKCTPLTQQYTPCGRNSRCVCHIWPYLAPLIRLRTIYITVKNIDNWILTLVADKLRRQWSWEGNRGYIPCPVKDCSSTWIRLPMKFIAYLHQKAEVLWLYSWLCIILMNSNIDVPGQHTFVVTCDWEVVHYKKAIVISTSHLLSEFKMSEHHVWTENSVNRLFKNSKTHYSNWHSWLILFVMQMGKVQFGWRGDCCNVLWTLKQSVTELAVHA